MQTSLKRCGLKFSLRKDMSAKFPRGGGAGPFLARSLNVKTAHANFHYTECGMTKLLQVCSDENSIERPP